jgi:transglutaminase-like putative cysteine protease
MNTQVLSVSSLADRIKIHLEANSPPKTEESLIFRILVQVLVIVGIVATDVAAATAMSLWAIPLSIVGAAWSWYRRKYRNVAAKFGLAIAMVAVLILFLGQLMAHLDDSRLILAGLLVQLQVLHSFDLPRRKDLGYSMAIGLILLGVAGTLSQTLAFAPWLLLFLAIALPCLVLDYRSRLGLDPIDERLSLPWVKNRPSRDRAQALNLRYSPFNWKRLGLLLAIALGLGLAIFLCMPRFPGYQLQTFPVSGSIDLENQQFNEKNQEIANSGYVKSGNTGEDKGESGNSPVKGAGEVDPTQYYGFNSTINQNLRGNMKPQVVMRVRSQAPGFWRVLSFDRYTGQGWEISDTQAIEKFRRPQWSYRFQLPSTNRDLSVQKVIQTYTAVKPLPNVVPALADPTNLFFPAREIGQDKTGSLRSPLGLMEGMTYTVISSVPHRDRTLLRTAPQEYPKQLRETYLGIPPKIADRVRQKTEAILARSPKPLTSNYEKALYLTQALKQNYTAQPDMPFLGDGEDLVEAFLFRHEGGYPDHFSTALTVMLRSIGIPARLTVGFRTGQFNPFTGFYIVRNTDAYALTEVYFPRFGWFAFDPLPGHPLIPPSLEEDGTFSVLKQFWNWIASWIPSPVTSFFSLLWNEFLIKFVQLLGGLWRFISGSLLGWLLGSILAIAIGFVGWLGWLQLLAWRERRRWAKLSPMAQLYQQMLSALKAKGAPKHDAQTPLEYLCSLRDRYSGEQLAILESVSHAYIGWRYGQQSPNIPELRKQLRNLLRGRQRRFLFFR